MITQLPNLISTDPVRYCSTDYLLDNAENHFGIKFPPSYRAFAKKYGYGLTAGLLIINVPGENERGYPVTRDLIAISIDQKEELNEAIKENWLIYTPDGDKELIDRLIPFGYSADGHIIAWDPAQQSTDGEMAIYIIGTRYHVIHDETYIIDEKKESWGQLIQDVSGENWNSPIIELDPFVTVYGLTQCTSENGHITFRYVTEDAEPVYTRKIGTLYAGVYKVGTHFAAFLNKLLTPKDVGGAFGKIIYQPSPTFKPMPIYENA